jgi:hypothetical protein
MRLSPDAPERRRLVDRSVPPLNSDGQLAEKGGWSKEEDTVSDRSPVDVEAFRLPSMRHVTETGSRTQHLRDLSERAPLVWKFGGTSVPDQVRLRAVAERLVAAQRAGHEVVAVLSAMGTSTDELSGLAYEVSARPPLRELDALLSVGESISCALASMAVAELGSRAVSLSGPQAGIRTDGNHGNARLNDIDPRRIRQALADGAIVLVTGFQGMSASGDITTLGRGGSECPACSPPTRASCPTHGSSTASATRRCWRWPRQGRRCSSRVRWSWP